MKQVTCTLAGAPVDAGAGRPGSQMGSDAYRTAGIAEAVKALGHDVDDTGNLRLTGAPDAKHKKPALRNLGEIIDWAAVLQEAAYHAAGSSDVPVFLGGDHSIFVGTVPGVARCWSEQERPLFVLRLGAHPDLHKLDTTTSGNLHGTPVAYFAGTPGFEGICPDLKATVPPENTLMMGIRSVDEAEMRLLADSAIAVHGHASHRRVRPQGTAGCVS